MPASEYGDIAGTSCGAAGLGVALGPGPSSASSAPVSRDSARDATRSATTARLLRSRANLPGVSNNRLGDGGPSGTPSPCRGVRWSPSGGGLPRALGPSAWHGGLAASACHGPRPGGEKSGCQPAGDAAGGFAEGLRSSGGDGSAGVERAHDSGVEGDGLGEGDGGTSRRRRRQPPAALASSATGFCGVSSQSDTSDWRSPSSPKGPETVRSRCRAMASELLSSRQLALLTRTRQGEGTGGSPDGASASCTWSRGAGAA
mmetsp:Transcript_19033/g.60474  ORF Transcript_19033/g.60474 Transcript_19033/m.60474 type:complete len:259 (+) Transcript_19033:159-935(+)